ncbi:MAG: ABC transporter permease, partial [Gammaproteobacteria bacterium]
TRAGAVDYATTIQGVGPELPALRDWPVAAGSFFTARDQRSHAPVAVLGQTVARLLFAEGVDPVGQFVLIRNVPFEVIGLLEEKGASTWGNDQDDVVFVPLTTGLVRLFGGNYLNDITIEVTAAERGAAVQAAAEALLRTRHRTEDFSIRNMASLLDMVDRTQGTLSLLLGSVAAISLLVGGIGVMNIMLVSVTERTREIGIRLAIGALEREVLLQFLIEAVVLAAFGGLAGIALATVASIALSNLMQVPYLFDPTINLLSFVFSAVIGVVFGFFPARRAARLDPIEALRHE